MKHTITVPTEDGEMLTLELTPRQYEQHKRRAARQRLRAELGLTGRCQQCMVSLPAQAAEHLREIGAKTAGKPNLSAGIRHVLAYYLMDQRRAADAEALHEHRVSTPASPDDPSAVLPIPAEPGAELYPPPDDPTTPDYDPDVLTLSDLIPSDDHAAILAGEDPRRA